VRIPACSAAWKLSFSVFPRVALPFPQFALLHSVTCVQLRLITVLGKCDCVAVSSFLDVPSLAHMDWINVAQDGDQWRAVVFAVV
jgi:hypothetical protein